LGTSTSNSVAAIAIIIFNFEAFAEDRIVELVIHC